MGFTITCDECGGSVGVWTYCRGSGEDQEIGCRLKCNCGNTEDIT